MGRSGRCRTRRIKSNSGPIWQGGLIAPCASLPDNEYQHLPAVPNLRIESSRPEATLSRRRLLSLTRSRAVIAATAICCFTCILLPARPAYALDPNKRVTQYLHTSWHIQDGSAPAGMFTVTQTADGFLWFSAYSPAIYRFDGVRFLPRHYVYKGGSSNKAFKVFADRAGGLWTVGSREIAYVKDDSLRSDFQLDGLSSFQNMSEDPDGSVWVVRAAANILDSALCHVTESAVKCFGKAEGVPISPIDSIFA